MLDPYPVHCRPAFASSGIPYPLVHRYTLAGDFPRPCWERSGLPRFARIPLLEGLGSASPPVVHHLRGMSLGHPHLTTRLLAHACQPLWHVDHYDGSIAVHVC